MLRWFGVKEGDEVIVPAYTYCATANVVVHCGAKVVFVDTGEDFNISVNAVEQAITSRTKVIMPVDLAGFPCDYDEINELAGRKDIREQFVPSTPEQEMLGRILVLSDAAHSVGARYKGKRTGSLTDITVYSFHAVKNLTTAEGGAVCLNLPEPFDNQEIYRQLNIKSLHGQSKDALAKTQIGNWRYDVLEPGYKYNMTDIQAAIGMVELERYDNDMLVRRKAIFGRYASLLGKYPWAQIPRYETPDKTSSYHVFLLRIKGITEEQRDRIISGVFRRDVAVNVHFVPLPLMSYYKEAGYRIEDYPVSYDNYSREITLPVYYDLTDEMVDTVVKAVAEVCSSE
jgi:dTDP-4-amino-4,6-dideoxygalactose transaminase